MAVSKSLHRRGSALASAGHQLDLLSNGIFANGELPKFKERLEQLEQYPLRPAQLEILQVNVGYMCNQVCRMMIV